MASKAQTLQKLLGSQFFREVCDITHNIDYTTTKLSAEEDPIVKSIYDTFVNEHLLKWEVAKSTLQFITGKTYAFTRNDDYYGIVNEADESDWLCQQYRQLQPSHLYFPAPTMKISNQESGVSAKFRKAIDKYGTPAAMVVDNGTNYRVKKQAALRSHKFNSHSSVSPDKAGCSPLCCVQIDAEQILPKLAEEYQKVFDTNNQIKCVQVRRKCDII